MSDNKNKPTIQTDGEASGTFQYDIKCVQGGWVNRCVLLRTSTMTPLETHDPSAGTLPLVFETVEDAKRFQNGLANEIAEIIQASSGLPFEQALEFAKAEITNSLIPSIPSNGVFGTDQLVYLVSF